MFLGSDQPPFIMVESSSGNKSLEEQVLSMILDHKTELEVELAPHGFVFIEDEGVSRFGLDSFVYSVRKWDNLKGEYVDAKNKHPEIFLELLKRL
jgi:hypothetical protein